MTESKSGPPTTCAYVKILGSLEEVKRHDEELHDQQTLTYDSEHAFCDVSDLEVQTQCCARDSRIIRDFHDSCNENSGCCGSMPDCVAHCSYTSVKELFFTPQSHSDQTQMLMIDLSEGEKRAIFDKCER